MEADEDVLEGEDMRTSIAQPTQTDAGFAHVSARVHLQGVWRLPDCGGAADVVFVFADAGEVELVSPTGQTRLRERELFVTPAGRWSSLLVRAGGRIVVGQMTRACAGDELVRMAGADSLVPTAAGAMSGLVAHVLRGLVMEGPATAISERAASHISGLLTLTIAEHHVHSGGRAGVTLFDEACAYIELNLSDSGLGQDRVAAALNVSTRTLARAFRQQGSTVSTWIRESRLERCRAELTDDRMRDVAVSRIGARWGLPDPSHFSHMFKARFGISPRALRAQQLDEELLSVPA
ncbi:helix-turn-helix transcriptional regulator [Microbacterium sp. F51-2R]|uniref:helix-turn-helix transcriptional regulator n=1 Tax=Microbacterium sp. F51-2R TaxID=3445777 RepID=UPI003FA1672B